MKSKKILLAILAVALVLGMTACDTGTSPGGTSGNTTETYESVGDDGTIYKLVINSARAASRAAAGDTFVLTITKLDGTTSTISGSVQNVANGAIILAPTNGGTITVTPSGGNMSLTPAGTIKDDSGTVISLPTVSAPAAGSTISGSTIASGLDVAYLYYDTSSNQFEPLTGDDLAAAKRITDFSYYFLNDPTGPASYEPLSGIINSPASVKVTNSKVTVSLGTPKASNRDVVNDMGFSLPTDVTLYYYIDNYMFFSPQDGGDYRMGCRKTGGDGGDTSLMYVSKDAIVKRGTPATATYEELSLKKGWNYIIWGDKLFATTTLPGGYQWRVIKEDW